MTVAFACRTVIAAPVDAVFAASLSIDEHLTSMAGSRERAIAGVTAGRVGLGQSVTWRARHFGITWTMTSQVTGLDEPSWFVDEQRRGPFKYFRHEHRFRQTHEGTEVVDEVTFDAPFGPIGWAAERGVLRWYLPRLIRQRNAYLKASLERSAGSGPNPVTGETS